MQSRANFFRLWEAYFKTIIEKILFVEDKH